MPQSKKRKTAKKPTAAKVRVAGGCDQCDAYQDVRSPAPGLTRITVSHDDDCPYLKSRTAREGARA